MEWCSRLNLRKKFKTDHVKSKSLLNIFIEYAWDYLDGECSGREDIQLINWIKFVNIDINNEKWFDTIEFDVRLASKVNSIDNVEWNENLIRRARKMYAAVKYVQLTFNLRKILPFLMDCNDDVNYTNDDGQTILHVFLEEYHTISYNISKDQLTRLRRVMKDLVERGTSFYAYDKNQKTPLHMIIESEETDLLEIIASIWPNVNERDEYGNTILHIIVDNCVNEIRFMYIIRTLVSKCVDINGKNNKGLTAVHLAAKNFHVEMLNFFADSGADFSQRTDEGETSLHLACKSALKMKDDSKTIETINLLISQSCKVEAVDREGYLPLHYAAEYGSSQLIECLIGLGANVDCRNEITWITPLFLASKANRQDNISALVQAGADVNAEAADGSTPIFIAALFGRIESFQYLVNQGADLYRRDQIRGYTLLHLTAYAPCSNSEIGLEMTTDTQATKRKKNRQNFDIVIDKGFNVNDPGKCGVTPLHFATLTDNLDTVKSLIERGANVNFQSDTDEWTALHLASIDDKFEIVKMLIEAGANVNCKGGIDQLTPLHLAVMNNIYWKLGKYPPSVAKSDRERSVIRNFWPSWRGRDTTFSQLENILLILIANGADVNAKDACRRSPLHLATLHLIADLTEILVKADAQINVQDVEGRLPLHNILQSGSMKGLQLLLDYGADINDIDTIELVMSAKDDLRRLVIKQAIKLKLIGLPIAQIYEQYTAAAEFVDFYERCLAEARNLIDYQVDGFSVYQFLHMDVKFQYSFRRIILSSSDTLTELFPIYSNVIRAAFREAVYRKPLLEAARLAWTEISTIHLPDVCIEHIFSHLNNRYLEVFTRSVESEVKIVCKEGVRVLRGSNKRSSRA